MSELAFLETPSEHVAVIVLNRPEKFNAFNKELLDALNKKLDALKSMPNIRVAIFMGAGDKAFSAGADLRERENMTLEDTRAFVHLIRETFNRIEALKIPTIAAINGLAFGGGLEMALACDLRVIDPEAKIGLTEVQWGILPGAGGTQRLSKIVGVAKAKEMIFLARRIDAREAVAIGLVNRMAGTNESALQCAMKFAKEIAHNAPLATVAAKSAINASIGVSIADGLKHEERAYESILNSEDRFEGLKAFKEKRPPSYTGK